MGSKSAAPTISKKQFDAIAPQLKAELEKWWAEEAQDFDAAIAGTPATAGAAATSGTGSVWDGMPEIDSKAVVKASPIIKKFTGGDLDPKHIKKGGYESFDALVKDLLPKLRASCANRAPARRAAPTSPQESINVRRS